MSGKSFSLGEGRFARSPIQFSVSAAVGYDDNIFTAANEPAPVPTPYVYAIAPRGTPITYVEEVETKQSLIYPYTVYFAPHTVTLTTPTPTPTPKTVPYVSTELPKLGSATTSLNAGMAIQLASPRNVFTLDLGLGGVYYYDRPDRAYDYNDTLALLYVHKFSPRMQLSIQANVAYLSQPNFAIVSGPTQNTNDYIPYTVNVSLSYQWSSKFSTVTTLTSDGIMYSGSTQTSYEEELLGNQFRFQYTPKTTLVAELREDEITYSTGGNTSTQFLLAGADLALSPRLNATVRGGITVSPTSEATIIQPTPTPTPTPTPGPEYLVYAAYTSTNNLILKTGTLTIKPQKPAATPKPASSSSSSANLSQDILGGGGGIGPYFESNITYTYGHGSSILLNGRLGFQPGTATSTQTSIRTGLTINQVLTAKISLTIAANVVYTVTTTPASGTSTNEEDFSLSTGVNYAFSPFFTISASFTHIDVISSIPYTSYDRDQLSLGGTYTF